MEKQKKFLWFFILFFVVLLLYLFNIFRIYDYELLDNLYGHSDNSSIVIVAVDDYSINSFGSWPLSRSVYADLLNKLDNASVVGIDISFFENSSNSSADALLSDAITDRVVLAKEFDASNNNVYLPIFNASSGFVNLERYSDGVIRSVFLRNDSFDSVIFSKITNSSCCLNKLLFIDFKYPGSFKTVSLYDVLNNNSVNFNGSVVLVGATANNLHDLHLTPVSKSVLMPGVEIHANILDSLLSRSFLVHNYFLDIIVMFIFTILFQLFLIYFKMFNRLFYAFILLIVFVIFYILFVIFMFDMGFILNIFYSLFIFVGSFVINIYIHYIEQKNAAKFVSDAFNKFLSKNLLKRIIRDPSLLHLGGEEKTIAILFTDIRGFTNISERLSTTELVDFLNDYFSRATRIIKSNYGFVDKFIGDAIMVLWNAPVSVKNYAFYSCKTAIELNKIKTVYFNHYKQKFNIELNFGIGLNIGRAIVGNIGCNEKLNYTAIGDEINVSSRIESLTKHYGVDILITENVISELKKEHNDKKFLYRLLDYVKVKGKNKAIKIYELIGFSSENIDMKYYKMYEIALAYYKNKDFNKAKVLFSDIFNATGDVPSKVFLDRINSLDIKTWSFEHRFDKK